MKKLKIEIEFPEFVTKMLSEFEYTQEHQIKIIKEFTENMLQFHNLINLQADLMEYIDYIEDSGELDDIIG